MLPQKVQVPMHNEHEHSDGHVLEEVEDEDEEVHGQGHRGEIDRIRCHNAGRIAVRANA